MLLLSPSHQNTTRTGWLILPALLLSASILSAQENSAPSIPIRAARVDTNGDYVPDRLGDTVTLAGRATVASGVLHRARTYIFLQDASAGIALFDWDADTRIEAGDSVVVRGTMGQYAGLTQLEILDYRVIEGAPQRMPRPVALASFPVRAEQYEGMLVQMNVRVLGRSRNAGGEYLLAAADTAERGEILRIFTFRLGDTGVDLGEFAKGDRLQVTGILGQFDPESPYDGYYQIHPRASADIVPIGTISSFDSRVVFSIAALFGLVVLALLFQRFRRRWRYRPIEAGMSEKPREQSTKFVGTPDSTRSSAAVGVEEQLDVLAEEIEGDECFPPKLGKALARACRRTPPIPSVTQLGRIVGRDRRTLSREMPTDVTPKEFLDHLLLIRALAEKTPALAWALVARRIGVSEKTLRRISKRCAGSNLGDLGDQGPRPLLKQIRRKIGLDN